MNRINVGVVGCGNMGQTHLRSLLNHPLCGTGHVTVVETNPETIEKLRREFGVPVVPEIDPVLADPQVLAVVIACPNRLHAAMAIRALAAGKHVLLEKPMALNEADARAVVAAARKTGKTLHVGFELRHSLLPRTVKEMINRGELGELLSAHVIHYRGGFWPPWKGQRIDGGSLHLMEMCHVIDLFRWWSGDEVARIIATGSRRNVQAYYEYPDTQFNTFEFRRGFVAHSLDCHARAAIPLTEADMYEDQYGHQYEYTLVGTQRALRFLPMRRVLYVYRHERQTTGEIWQRLERVVDFSQTHTLHDVAHDTTTEMDEFLTAAREGRDTHITPDDALQTHLVCLAAQKALDDGVPVKM